MGIEVRYQKVNGVETPYWVPVFDTNGADGLIGADARILEIESMQVNDVQTPYWIPDTDGTKYGGTPPTTQIYPVNSVTLNPVSLNRLESPDTSYLNIGTGTFAICCEVEIGVADATYLYSKGDLAASGHCTLQITNTNVLYVYIGVASQYQVIQTDPLPTGKHSLVINLHRTSLLNQLDLYIDGVLYTGGLNYDTRNFDSTGVDLTYTEDFTIGSSRSSNVLYHGVAPVFTGYLLNQQFTLADAVYLNDLKCWDSMVTENPTLTNKFTEYFDLGTYNGSTELQALTGHVNGWVLNNVNSAPFTNQGFTVECAT